MRETLQLLVAAALVLGAGFLVYRLLFIAPEQAPLVIEAVTGQVSLEAAGRRQAAEVGLTLGGSDRLVSGADGSAVIAVGADSKLTLSPGSAMEVLPSEGEEVRVALEDGRIQATVRPGDDAVSVLAGERTVTARDADFSAAYIDGDFEARVSRGGVQLAGFGGIRELDEGERVRALDGQAPTREPVPEDLLLQVQWPERRTREEEVVLAGTTEPGARVTVQTPDGLVDAVADAEGRFEVRVALAKGENAVLVRSEGLMGERAADEARLTRDADAPKADFQIRY